jgi:Ino eighty subunit 2
MDMDEEEVIEKTPPRPPSPPTMYRWISTIRPAVEAAKPEEEAKDGGQGEDKTEVKRESPTEERSDGAKALGEEESKPAVEEKSMTISFSVPVSLLPRISESEQKLPLPVPGPVAICDYEGCSLGRKYRLVKDWTKGACGMAHLKALESTVMDTGV